MPRKKPKLTPEERQMKIYETQNEIKKQIAEAGTRKNELIDSVVRAQKKGLTSQANMAKSWLKKCLAAERQAEGMLMTLEIAMQARGVAGMVNNFLDCLSIISDEMKAVSGKTDFKKAQREYLRAIYETQRQSDMLDRFLEGGESVLSDAFETGDDSEFDSEIDALVKAAVEAEENADFVREEKAGEKAEESV